MATRPATAPDATPTAAHAAGLYLRDDAPRQGGGGGGGVGDEEGVYVHPVGCEAGAGVEAEPSEPEQGRAEYDVWHVVWLRAGIAPLADEEGCRDRRDAGVDVDDGTSSEVERAVANVADPASAPDPVGNRERRRW